MTPQAKGDTTLERQMTPIHVALHDLCQPLTTLQCSLEMAGVVDTPEAYQEAVMLGLVECARLMNTVKRIREILDETSGTF